MNKSAALALLFSIALVERSAIAEERTAARVGAVATSALLGLGVFFAFEAHGARRHEVDPTDSDADRIAAFSFAAYMSFGLALAAGIVTVVLVAGEDGAEEPAPAPVNTASLRTTGLTIDCPALSCLPAPRGIR